MLLALVIGCFFLSLLMLVRATFPAGVARWWISVFISAWAVSLFFSAINPFDLLEVRLEIYALYVLFVSSFAIGFASISRRDAEKFKKVDALLAVHATVCRSRLAKVGLILCILLLLNYVEKYLSYIILVGTAEAREARFFIGKIFQSGYEYFLFTYLITPIVWLCKFFVAFGIAFGIFRSWTWLLSVVVVLLYMAFGAGRNVAIEVFLMTLFVYALKMEEQTERRWSKGMLGLGVASAFFVLVAVLLTAFRMQEFGELTVESLEKGAETLAENFGVYFLGALRAFQHATDHQTQYQWLSYGGLTFSGVDEIASYLFKGVGFDVDPYSWSYSGVLGSEIDIGGAQGFNALYTALYYFYFDFGILGVMLFSLGFGATCAAVWRQFLRSGEFSTFFACTLLFVASIWTLLTWRFQSGDFVLLVAGSLLLPFVKKIRIR